ncbi:DUF819 domain-containing protein [Pseudoteredinibacter isoporae]|uniref:Putative membrane protein n=1 Tax=Pseudoteredinibacter isoporae TaxID=570281 RepID=A0A7X0JSW8_9GAMM|nr:DUF819 family protein [Pseudoteredinibacter isoporae]MBB6521675.1 putative membrane protein [Pseudoteredinibacter isoporae]NHO87223.1 DUF819 family protein [Pseudoteredinibacter isoporae]NIB23145.1 DUF819 family protein [Pseudoteredinibacter isoporae]
MNTSLIPADAHFAVAAALFAIALFGFWAERQSWGKVLTGAVWVLLLAILASNVALIPKSADFYGLVFSYFVPVLIPLFLLRADVRKIIAESGRVGVAFLLAAVGSALGAMVGVNLLDLGAKEAELGGIFTATYVGGSVNYAALIQATGFDDASVISAATAVDSLMSALFLAVIAIMPASQWLMGRFAERDHSQEIENDSSDVSSEENVPTISAFSLCAALVFSISVVALSDALILFLQNVFEGSNFKPLRYIFITVLSVLPATFAPKTMQSLRGGEEIGLILAFVFFAAICAGADVFALLGTAPILLAFVVILLLVHGGIVFIGAWCINKGLGFWGSKSASAKLSLPELIIASNAAILGATTAPALAMARGWPALVTPGILVGVAGYIIGTPLGILVVSLLSK